MSGSTDRPVRRRTFVLGTAATGLGLMGRSCPATAKRKLDALAESDEQQVQIAARRAASLCGKP